jgi:hypothetical protein
VLTITLAALESPTFFKFKHISYVIKQTDLYNAIKEISKLLFLSTDGFQSVYIAVKDNDSSRYNYT